MSPRVLRIRRIGLLLAVAGLALVGCAGGGRGVSAGGGVRVAVLPFENLSERSDAGEVATRIAQERLAEREGWEPLPAADVDAALEELRIRDTGAVPRDQAAALGQKLGVRYLLAGSVLESGVVRTADGDVPSIGLALELRQVASGQVAWRRMKFRTGDDHETLFGWGRVTSAQKLMSDLVAQMMKELPRAGADSALGGEGEKR